MSRPGIQQPPRKREPRGAFVRALWGDPLLPRSRTKTLADVREAATHPHPVPFRAFSFGAWNHRYLERQGIPSTLLANSGIVNFFNAARRNPTSQANWGVSLWRHKLVAIAAALETAPDVVWLDWDCRLLRPLPANFWWRLRRGAALQGSLRRYRRPKCLWRADERGRRLLMSGAWIYVRGRVLAQRLLDVQAENPLWCDELTLCRVSEELRGGAWDVEGHYAAGMEPYCYKIPGQLRRPDVPLFTAK